MGDRLRLLRSRARSNALCCVSDLCFTWKREDNICATTCKYCFGVCTLAFTRELMHNGFMCVTICRLGTYRITRYHQTGMRQKMPVPIWLEQKPQQRLCSPKTELCQFNSTLTPFRYRFVPDAGINRLNLNCKSPHIQHYPAVVCRYCTRMRDSVISETCIPMSEYFVRP